MSTDKKTDRTYSEEEFALILRKASELQESPKGAKRPGERPGLTLQEIQSIAREAGIDSEAISRAAALLGAMEAEERSGLGSVVFGLPGRFNLDFQIPGRLPQGELGRILALIRREVEQQGQASEVLGGVEWKTVGELNNIHVNISPRGESTSVQIVGDRSAAGAITFTFPMAAAAVLVGALGAAFEPSSAVGIVSLVGGLLGSGFLFARTLWVMTGKRFHRKLSRLMEALSLELEQASLPPFRLEEWEDGDEGSKGDDL